MTAEDKLIFVGAIAAARGIKGEVVIKSFTHPITNIAKLELQEESGNKFTLKITRHNAKGELICRVNNITNRNEIERLKGTKLYCLRSNFPVPAPNEFYIEDLKTLPVFDIGKKPIGTIKNVFNFGAGDIVEIEFNNGQIELFPFTIEIFPDIASNYVIFVPPIVSK